MIPDLSLALVTAVAVLPLPTIHQDDAASPFPPATALEAGLSPDALAKLSDLVRGFVDADEVVGAELLVVKGGRTVLHEGYGWRDREAEVPMEPGTVVCVRSMTKPFVGTAILMLVDEDAIDLNDRVSEHLPALDTDACRAITVEQLLTHSGGFPYSSIAGASPQELVSLEDVVARGVAQGLEFEPGTDGQYSDQGTDTLARLVEVVSGKPVEVFVRERILEPLAMRESTCVLERDHPLRARASSLYLGAQGAWKRWWTPDGDPLFPIFLGSQGLYSTATDYARFLQFWMDRGRVDGERLLSSRSWRKALREGPHPLGLTTGFPSLEPAYGFLMQLWFREDEDGKRELAGFGHSGSDGTHAWAFPDEDAVVLYLTQSRGNLTGLRVEEALAELFFGEPFDPNAVAPPLEDYLGLYWEGEGDLYRAIVRQGSGLGLEILGKAVVPLLYAGDDRWKIQPDPSQVLDFQRDAEGRVTGYRVGEHEELRFEPDTALPSADEVVERVLAFHGVGRIAEVGPVRVRGALDVPKLGLAGPVEVLVAPDGRFRVDFEAGDAFERLAFDGARVAYASHQEGPMVAEEPRASNLRLNALVSRLGDWRELYASVQVVQRLVRGGDERVLVVRTVPAEGPASTKYVHEDTGRVVRDDAFVIAPGAGTLGQRVTLGDVREVSGLRLPEQVEYEYATPLLGKATWRLDTVEVGVALEEGAFELR